jgi:hypothetical protein
MIQPEKYFFGSLYILDYLIKKAVSVFRRKTHQGQKDWLPLTK